MAPKKHCSPWKGAMKPHGSTAGLTAGAGFAAKAGLTAALLASSGLSKKAGLTAGAGLTAKRQRPAPEHPNAKRQRSMKGTHTSSHANEASSCNFETEESHLRRHPIYDPACARCAFRKYGAAWRSMATWKPRYDSVVSHSWLAERPAYMGGSWALGCLVCASAAAARGNLPSRKRRLCGKWNSEHRASTWSRFAVRRL